MEATTIIQLKSLEPYRHLFPKATTMDNTVKMGATVSDTVDFIPEVVKNTQWQVEKFVNQELRGLSTYSACEKLWHFVKYHIRYKKDKRGLEQVRSPRRLIHDGVGDCDCFTTFISTCLIALKIPVINRITKYKADYFQHIYPIVPLGNGKYITMDCVVDRFNYEEPYTEKKDFKMDLQYLDGIEENAGSNLMGNVDLQDLMGWDNDMGDLGKLFKKRANKSTSAMPEQNQGGKKGKKGFQKFKQIAKKVLNVTNKANPATALLRAGILASMKLNIMKVAQRLKWAYLTEDEARKKGADMSKFGKLKNILYKIEQIFYTAGGKPENLKKSILSGRGNRNKEVSGFGLIDARDVEFSGIDESMPLNELLGDVYHDEFVNGIEDMNGLGELGSAVAAGASITAASTVMASIAALLKSLGNIFPNKKNNSDFKDEGSGDGGSGSDSGGDSGDSGSSESNTPSVKTSGGDNSSSSNDDNSESNNTPAQSKSKAPASNDESGSDDGENTNGTSSNKSKAPADDSETTPTGIKGFWENNKKWIKPVGIGAVVAGVLYAGYRMVTGNKEKKKAPANNGQAALNGFSSHKHKKRKKGKKKHRGGHGKKSNIALM